MRVRLARALDQRIRQSTLGRPTTRLAADPIAVMIGPLRIGRQELEPALAGDRAALVERWSRWNAGALVRGGGITPCPLRFARFERGRYGRERRDGPQWFQGWQRGGRIRGAGRRGLLWRRGRRQCGNRSWQCRDRSWQR